MTATMSSEESDVVYLHGQACIGLVPTISPFVLKLESWLRMVDIPYTYVINPRPTCKTKQHPWVVLNGEEICDTNLIIPRLSQHFNKVVDEDLSPEQRAVSLAFIRTIEEHTFQAYVWYRYVHKPDEFWGCFNLAALGPAVEKRFDGVAKLLQGSVKEKSWHHGIGRKSPSDIYRLTEADLKALSVFLGNKTFMMGSEPSLIDCVMFGHLVQLVYIPLRFPPKETLERDCPNLVTHTHTMRDRLFPDWEVKCQPKFY